MNERITKTVIVVEEQTVLHSQKVRIKFKEIASCYESSKGGVQPRVRSRVKSRSEFFTFSSRLYLGPGFSRLNHFIYQDIQGLHSTES